MAEGENLTTNPFLRMSMDNNREIGLHGAPANDTGFKVHWNLGNSVARFTNTLEAFDFDTVRIENYRSSSTAYNFLKCVSDSNGTPDNEFILRGDGTGYADTSWTTPAADYAEWFEAEELVPEGELVGLNIETGLVRIWRKGDPKK